MPKINQEEYEVLKGLDDKWKWIARNEDRCLYVLTEKPVRKDGYPSYWGWFVEPKEGPYASLELFDEKHLFQFIQWENEEPYNIAELIKEYESEETEMKKDIEWAKKEIKKIHTLTFEAYEAAVIANNKYFQMKNSEQLAFINKVLEILNQLDEPEVLSQELPVIPEFVAEWITAMHNGGFDLYPALKRLENNALSWEDVYEWYRKNTRKFVNAYLTGKYEVEEEQKYVVELPNPNNQMGRHKNVFLNKKDGKVFIDSASLFVNDITKYGQFALTEEEIKKDFEWAWKFAVKVEELEE